VSDPGDRIQALDVLRGFALCGIVFINIYQTLGMRDLPAALGLFVQHRFFVIFSLLFGIGFAIFLERASARSDRPRLLLPYAICGLVFLLPFSYAPARVNLVAGLALLALGTVFVGGVAQVPGLFLIGWALAAYRVPEELPGQADRLGRLFALFTLVALAAWWLSPLSAGGPDIGPLQPFQPLVRPRAGPGHLGGRLRPGPRRRRAGRDRRRRLAAAAAHLLGGRRARGGGRGARLGGQLRHPGAGRGVCAPRRRG